MGTSATAFANASTIAPALWKRSPGSLAMAFSITCAVFAMSEMVSQLVGGASQADVVAGMHRAFARRISELVPEAENIVLIGGGARNRGLVSELSSILEVEVHVPDRPSHVNALGAVEYMTSSPPKG